MPILTAKAIYTTQAVVSGASGALMLLVARVGVGGAVVMQAFGLHISLAEFAAGLFFAVTGAFVALAHTPPTERATLWATLFAGLMIGMMTAVGHPHVPYAKDFPVQLVMGIGGLSSRKMVDLSRKLDPGILWSNK